MPDAQERILARVSRDSVVGMTRELVRRPSVNPPGDYAAVADEAERLMREVGLVDIRRSIGEPGRPNIVGRLPGAGGGPAFCLSSHMDVVDPGDLSAWKYPPFEARVEEGILWGRGTADSKGMLAGMLEAIRAIRASGVRLKGDLWFVAAVDDETAGRYGLRYPFEKGLVPARAAILGEATNFDVPHVFKGRIWFELDVIGKASHGAFPEDGVNAIEKAGDVIRAVKGIALPGHPRLGKDTVSVGTIRGGKVVNVGAELCTPAFDIRWWPPLTSRDIRDKVKEAAESAARAGGFRVSDLRASEERDPLEFSEGSGLVRAVRAACKTVRGKEAGLIGWYSSGEIFHMHRNGNIEAGALFGPGEPWQAHAIDEHITLQDLEDGAKVYALIALEMCGGEG
ncbi:MAG: M20/M25/M40 family metallo-hydrolase [Candidatus Tectomicrobia bacterium]|uniref:M20/M25/M40 family metallo-hydrolase n=1 Tax=Tectimicrobiota bacterium TaxID=2528274 RepID=A0A932MLD5_UNCTE|nr:M20/M25/M40 family metallo-hydrolase [Candidatus Tectomicrobia bacterium]